MPTHTKKISLLREQKEPKERRVALTPEQCAELMDAYPGLKISIQPCPDRGYPDAEYAAAGVLVQEALLEGAYLFGIKERKPGTLLPGGRYLLFSHTIKKQPANQASLREYIDKGATLYDYECILDQDTGLRTVAFGHFAGMVGALHAIRMVGLREGKFTLRAPKDYHTLGEVKEALADLPIAGKKFVLTGHGRVSAGAKAILAKAHIKQIEPAEFLTYAGAEPVYCQLGSADLYAAADGTAFDRKRLYSHPELFVSLFGPYLAAADVLITGAFWGPGYPQLFATDQLALPKTRLRLIADVSCDINGAVPCTHRASTIHEPYYDIDPAHGPNGSERPAFSSPHHTTLMAVDNLPCEMPKEASRHFGEQLMQYFMGDLLGQGPVAERSKIVAAGHLTAPYQYLAEWAGAVSV